MELRIKGSFDRNITPQNNSPVLGIINNDVVIVRYFNGEWQQIIIEDNRVSYRTITGQENFEWFIVQGTM